MKTLNNYIHEKLIINKNYKNDIYFLYKLKSKDYIKIFSGTWIQSYTSNKYKNNVYINGKQVEINDGLTNAGLTVDQYDPGIYEVEIKDINNVTNCNAMFYNCFQLIHIPYFDTSNVDNMEYMFYECTNLVEVPCFDLKSAKFIHNMFSHCTRLKEVPMFTNIQNDVFMNNLFYECEQLSNKTKQRWSKIYDFEKNAKVN